MSRLWVRLQPVSGWLWAFDLLQAWAAPATSSTARTNPLETGTSRRGMTMDGVVVNCVGLDSRFSREERGWAST